MYIINRGDGGDTPCQEYKLHFNFAARFLVHQISWPRMQGKLLLDEIKYCFVLLAQ